MRAPGAASRLASAAAFIVLLLPAAVSAVGRPVDPPTPANDPPPAGNADHGSGQAPRLHLHNVTVEGVDYYAFSLEGGRSDPKRERDDSPEVLRLYVSGRAHIRDLEVLAAEGDLLVDLLAAVDDARSHGSRGDRTEYLLPTATVQGLDSDRYLYLYSKSEGAAGELYSVAWSQGIAASQDGIGPIEVAEPAAPLLLAVGAFAMAWGRRKARR
jgi:hypothetical protein